MSRTLILGLVGGIGSGKSRVAAALAKRGARIVSGDEAGHEALRQPEIREQVVRRWGKAILAETGEINRRALGRIVFANETERQALEGMVFPYIGRRLREDIAKAQTEGVPLIVLDAAIMLETGWHRNCDKIVYVDAPREIRLQRLVQTRGWDEAEVERRERAQWLLAEKAERGDFVIDNAGSPAELEQKVDELLRKLLNV